MKRLLFLPFTMIAAAPAWAEVCDKAFGDWRAEQGPMDVWTLANSWKVIAFVIAVCALSLLFRSRGIAVAAALLLLIPALLGLYLWLWPEDHAIARAAISQGCASGDPVVALIGAFWWAAAAAACFVLPRLWIPHPSTLARGEATP